MRAAQVDAAAAALRTRALKLLRSQCAASFCLCFSLFLSVCHSQNESKVRLMMRIRMKIKR